MIYSSKYSYIVLRVGLAAVFFWFGVTTFLYTAPWLAGVIEILIGLSLLTGVFTRVFALGGVLVLLWFLYERGLSIEDAQNIGLIGGLLAIFLWPERR